MLIPLYISRTRNRTKLLYRIDREIYLVSNLKVYMLIGNDIVEPEQIMLNVSKS